MYIACNMPGIRSSRFLTFGGLVIVFCAVAGGFWGRSALVAQDQIPDQYKVFTAALGAIEENYVGEYESDRLVYSAISGMLQTLDPHSSFMDPAQLRADARAAGRALLRPRHLHPGRRRRHHRLQRLRGIARLSEGPSPR